METSNKLTILIEGKSGSGKSSSFAEIPAEIQKETLFLNAEGKELPFAHDFTEFKITEPYQLHAALKRVIEGKPFKHRSGEMIMPKLIGLDSFTFLMDQFVAQYVNTAEDTRGAWGDYAGFIRTTMLELVAKLHIPFIATTHILVNDDMESMEKVSRAAIQGGIGKGNGLESYFTTVLYAKQMRLRDIDQVFLDEASMLTLTEEDKFDEKKHVFVTRPAKQHSGDRIKSPRGMFSPKDLYMDNSIPKLITHIHNFYKA